MEWVETNPLVRLDPAQDANVASTCAAPASSSRSTVASLAAGAVDSTCSTTAGDAAPHVAEDENAPSEPSA